MATFRCRDLSAAADLGLDVRWGRYYVPRWSNTAKIRTIEGQRRRRRVKRKRQKPPVRVTPNKEARLTVRGHTGLNPRNKRGHLSCILVHEVTNSRNLLPKHIRKLPPLRCVLGASENDVLVILNALVTMRADPQV
jgi:hypothetical protein